MPNAQYFGGMFRRTKVSVSGMKKPDASPPRNCITSSAGSVVTNGVSSETPANARDAPVSTRRAPQAAPIQMANGVTNICATV